MTSTMAPSRTDLDRTLGAVPARGWRVVLLEERLKRPPLGAPWTITSDAPEITKHVRTNGNIGLVTHEETGVAVLDPDKILEWSDMMDALGQPAAAWVETASGRLHYYIQWEPNLPAKLIWDGETIGEIQRGPGQQQVVIPPSMIGRPYQWLVDPATEPLCPLPPIWRAYLRSLASPAGSPRVQRHAGDYLAAALEQPGAIRRHSGIVKFQCPGCRAEGHDEHRDNAGYFTGARTWGCAWAKDSAVGRAHWESIGAALGAFAVRNGHAAVPPAPPVAAPLALPEIGLVGVAREFADLYAAHLESPRAFFYFAFLTYFGSLISRKITLDSELRPSPRLYTVLIGESADTRKSTALTKVDQFFRSLGAEWEPHTLFGVGSAEGIAAELKESPDLLLHFDELKAFVDKAKNEHSIALPMVSTLFERADYDNRTKTERLSIRDGALSLVAACTADTYATMFDTKFLAIGFPNRLWLVSDRSTARIAVPRMIPEGPLEALRTATRKHLERIDVAYRENQSRPVAYRLSSGALDMFKSWYLARAGSIFERRLDTYAHRLMLLLAATCGQTVIDETLVSRVVALLRYQLDVRRECDPVDAENTVATMEERIRRALARGAIRSSPLKRKVHYSRTGLWVWNTAIENLKRAGEILFDADRDLFWVALEGPELHHQLHHDSK